MKIFYSREKRTNQNWCTVLIKNAWSHFIVPQASSNDLGSAKKILSRMNQDNIFSYPSNRIAPAPVGHFRGIHRKTSWMCLYLLLFRWSPYLVHPTWTFCEMGGKRPYSCCFIGRYSRYLFRTLRHILCTFVHAFLERLNGASIQ